MTIPSIQQMQEAVAIKEKIAQLESQLRRTLGIDAPKIQIDTASVKRFAKSLRTVKTAPAAKTASPKYLARINKLLY